MSNPKYDRYQKRNSFNGLKFFDKLSAGKGSYIKPEIIWWVTETIY